MTTPRIRQKSGHTCEWGTGGVGTVSQGTVVSASVKRPSDKEQGLDENGFVVCQVFVNFRDEVTLKVRCKSSMPNPAEGEDFSFTGGLAITGIIQNWNIDWEQKGFKMLSIDVTKWTEALA